MQIVQNCDSKKFLVRFRFYWRSPGFYFHWSGLKKCFLQFKTLQRVINIPPEGFRYLSRGVIIPLEGFSYPSWGVIIPLEGFIYPSWGFIIPMEGSRYPSYGFTIPLLLMKLELILHIRMDFYGRSYPELGIKSIFLLLKCIMLCKAI